MNISHQVNTQKIHQIFRKFYLYQNFGSFYHGLFYIIKVKRPKIESKIEVIVFISSLTNRFSLIDETTAQKHN